MCIWYKCCIMVCSCTLLPRSVTSEVMLVVMLSLTLSMWEVFTLWKSTNATISAASSVPTLESPLSNISTPLSSKYRGCLPSKVFRGQGKPQNWESYFVSPSQDKVIILPLLCFFHLHILFFKKKDACVLQRKEAICLKDKEITYQQD